MMVGRRGLMDRASASYPHGVKGLGLKPPWRQKLYNCNLYSLMKYRLKMVIKEVSLGKPTIKKSLDDGFITYKYWY